VIIFYTPEAIEDLKRLREFLAEKNPGAAQKIGNELAAGIAVLKEFPKLERKVAKAPDPEIQRLAAKFPTLCCTSSIHGGRRNPDYRDVLSLPSMALDTRFQASMTSI
jgi:plasmid stabilization system protein ParE